ncbi:MAG: sigma-70 family RNA polymerase sigma factor [Phycisphaerales bacterium]|nr:MAG: sigma-70 family RNA polymerase sigma factor [Phycisphaerales bacterium]
MLEDKRLLGQLKRGDKEALCQIYMEYKDNLLTIATSLLHDPSAAEDVLHDVFVSFAAVVGSLRLRGSLRNYLVASIVNRVRDVYRRKKHHLVELDEAGPVASGSEDPGQAAVVGEEARRLTGALAQLPSDQRETIVLHLNAGMKFKEIAQMQGIPISTVQGRYRYGLGKLRTILKER